MMLSHLAQEQKAVFPSVQVYFCEKTGFLVKKSHLEMSMVDTNKTTHRQC